LFQSGALWSSMTVAENVALPLQMFTHLGGEAIGMLVDLKLFLRQKLTQLWSPPLPPRTNVLSPQSMLVRG
jgi:ABC-type sugar transport system ATPase subunit